jgi:hypothetical protein
MAAVSPTAGAGKPTGATPGRPRVKVPPTLAQPGLPGWGNGDAEVMYIGIGTLIVIIILVLLLT